MEGRSDSAKPNSATLDKHLDQLDYAPHPWDRPDRVTIQVRLEWKPLGRVLLMEDRLLFPPSPALPGLYRFRLIRGGKESRYFGETDNISRRFAHYRNPGPSQETNLRINALFREALVENAEIAVALVTEGASIDRGGGLETCNLERKSVRRLLENAALIGGGGIDVAILNLGD
jgi:hypothetical protein